MFLKVYVPSSKEVFKLHDSLGYPIELICDFFVDIKNEIWLINWNEWKIIAQKSGWSEVRINTTIDLGMKNLLRQKVLKKNLWERYKKG